MPQTYAAELKAARTLNVNLTIRPDPACTPAYAEIKATIANLYLLQWTGADVASGLDALSIALARLAREYRALEPITPLDGERLLGTP